MAKCEKEEQSPNFPDHVQPVNLILAIEELSVLTSQELGKLWKESENSIIQYNSKTGSVIQIDVERLAVSLPLHLIAILVSNSEQAITLENCCDKSMPLQYLLHGFRLLYSFSDLASQHMRFEQIMLEEISVSEQVLDLVFYMLLVLARYNQDNQFGLSVPLLHSALVASSFHLLTTYISSQWQDLVIVLLAHPKIEIFIEAAIDAVHVAIKFLHVILSTLNSDVLENKFSIDIAERIANGVCQQCEASLQFVVFLCQQNMFRDCMLKNKELCKTGVLFLTQTILELNIPQSFQESFEVVAVLSRLKSKVLSILLQLCEAEHISYLDEVAGSSKSMVLAKSVFLKILELLKVTLGKEAKSLADSIDRRTPAGLVLLNSMRLVDSISDDSNFRSFFMVNMSCVLADILAMPHELFVTSWCSTDSPIEEDVILYYDPFIAFGMTSTSISICSKDTLPTFVSNDGTSSTYPLTFNCIHQASYGHQRTSYLVKIIANFHCFVPDICQEQEKDLFLNKFCECLHMDVKSNKSFSYSSSNVDLSKGSTICRNMCSLKDYAQSLIPNLLNDEDLDLLSLFYKQLLTQIPSNLMEDFIQDQSAKEQIRNHDDNIVANGVPEIPCHETDKLNPIYKTKDPSADSMKVDQDRVELFSQVPFETRKTCSSEFQNIENDGLDMKNGNVTADLIVEDDELSQMVDSIKEGNLIKTGHDDEKTETLPGEERQPRKRKRNIMNDKQITMIENVLLEEPEMQRNATMLQTWAEKLSFHGSELTPSQLKNWLNNRKARLARAAAAVREVHAPSEEENTFPDRSSISHFYDSPESVGEESCAASTSKNNQTLSKCFNTRSKTEVGEITTSNDSFDSSSAKQIVHASIGQSVYILDAKGKEMGWGKIYQTKGQWHGKNMEDLEAYVISIVELKVDRSTPVLLHSDSAGATFELSEAMNGGHMRVAWQRTMIKPLPE